LHASRARARSFWEGGVRATAFISGGFVPQAQRGTTQPGLLHIADWYGTLAELAGVDPTDPVAAAAGLPPVDSVNVWPMLSGANATSPRAEIPLSPTGIVSGRYKLLLGQQGEAAWAGPQYPNASSPAHPVDPGPSVACGATGCLFDVVADPSEHTNIASANPTIVAAMHARLKELVPGFYSNSDVLVDDCPPGISQPCACWAATNVWGGYFGPYAHA
jgi:arylsulfatase A-like enzyme